MTAEQLKLRLELTADYLGDILNTIKPEEMPHYIKCVAERLRKLGEEAVQDEADDDEVQRLKFSQHMKKLAKGLA